MKAQGPSRSASKRSASNPPKRTGAIIARYAALCQEETIVPIVEPEVLMDGDHSIDDCAAVTEWVLKEVFYAFYNQRVDLERMVLKPNMIVPGAKCPQQASVDEVAERTV